MHVGYRYGRAHELPLNLSRYRRGTPFDLHRVQTLNPMHSRRGVFRLYGAAAAAAGG